LQKGHHVVADGAIKDSRKAGLVKHPFRAGKGNGPDESIMLTASSDKERVLS
jgi:hypothetical protein